MSHDAENGNRDGALSLSFDEFKKYLLGPLLLCAVGAIGFMTIEQRLGSSPTVDDRISRNPVIAEIRSDQKDHGRRLATIETLSAKLEERAAAILRELQRLGATPPAPSVPRPGGSP
jgi:hypothetical protein